MKPSRPLPVLKLLAIALPLILLPGCVPLIAVGVATGVYTATQERSIGHALTDSRIEVELEADLLDGDPALFRGLTTNVIEGRVYLMGALPSVEARRDATRIAWNIAGVTAVHNDAEITDYRGVGTYADDKWTAAAVRLSLIEANDVSDQNYSIEVIRGVAYVMGIAADEDERQRALDIARETRGVTKVVDYTVLKDSPQRTSLLERCFDCFG